MDEDGSEIDDPGPVSRMILIISQSPLYEDEMLRDIAAPLRQIHEDPMDGCIGSQQSEIHHAVQPLVHVGVPADAVVDRGAVSLTVLQKEQQN